MSMPITQSNVGDESMNEPLFKEIGDGLIEYCGPTDAASVVEHWREFDAKIDMDIWGQASIAAAVVPVYGKQDMEEFAGAVEKSVCYVRRMSKTYRYFTKNDTRVSNLSFKHHSVSLRYTNPKAALLLASEKGWSATKLEEWVINELAGTKPGGRSGLSEIKLSELREFLAHVEEVIDMEFIAKCPDRGFAARVFGAWKAEAREENKQLYISDLREIVREAITRGARNVKELTKTTGIKQHEVEAAVHYLVTDSEEYEWIEEGGETDQARGSNPWILHKVGDRGGDAYNVPRTSNNYTH